MKKTFLILTGIFLTLTNLHGQIIERQMPIKAFEAIKLRVPGKLVLKEGKGVSLTLRGDSKTVKHIKAAVKNRELDIYTERSRLRNVQEVEYLVTYDTLMRLYLFGQSAAQTTNPIKEETFYLVISGSAKAHLELEVNRFNVDISGSGLLDLSGSAKYQDVHIAGNGKFKGFNLKGDEGVVSVSGAGLAEVNVKDMLSVKIKGAGKVSYNGTPTITQDIRGAGSLEGS